MRTQGSDRGLPRGHINHNDLVVHPDTGTPIKKHVDNEEGSVDLGAFNFAPDDPSAPHYPVSISHSSDLVGLDPSRDNSWASTDLVEAAYREFVDTVSAMLEEGA